MSGKDINKPKLAALLADLRDGDAVVIHSMNHLARNLDDPRRMVQALTAKGARIEFIKGGTV